jgi:hypothetical protein
MDDNDDHPGKLHPEQRFKGSNVGPDGDYLVGKNRPPKRSQFAAGDGRKRGRRPKGQRNFDTEFQEEAARLVTLRENGKERRVTKLRSAIVRVFDNAGAKGQNQAIATVFTHGARIADKVSPPSLGLTADEDAIVNAWIAQRFISPEGDDQPGHPGQVFGATADREQPDGEGCLDE